MPFCLDFYPGFVILSAKCFHAFSTVLLGIAAHLKILRGCVLFWSDKKHVSFHFYWNGNSHFQLWSGFPDLFSVPVWSNLCSQKPDPSQSKCFEKSTSQPAQHTHKPFLARNDLKSQQRAGAVCCFITCLAWSVSNRFWSSCPFRSLHLKCFVRTALAKGLRINSYITPLK